MLRIIAYLNILLSISYFFAFLQGGSFPVMLGISLVVIHSLLRVRNIQQERKSGILDYMLGTLTMGLGGYLLIGLVHIVRSSLDYGYFGNTWFYILLTGCFLITILIQFAGLFFKRA